MNKKISLIVILVVVGSLMIVGILFFFIPKYRSYQHKILSLPSPSLFANINPPEGYFTTGSLAAISFSGSSTDQDSELIELTLWANSEPLYSVDFVGQEQNNHHELYSWIPTIPGQFVFFARVTDQSGRSADSDPVMITILPNEMKGFGAESISADSSTHGSVPMDGAGGVAEPWGGSIGGMLFPSDDASVPNAPEVSAAVKGCDVTLRFLDNSDNEVGFRVYRHLPEIPGWKLAETLAPNDNFDYLEFVESGFFGHLNFKVSAFNTSGDADSNVVNVYIDPDECPVQESPFVTVVLSKLKPAVPINDLYCYFSVAGGPWQRTPQYDFIPVGSDGVQMSSDLFAVPKVGAGESLQIPDLILDCLGWNGDELVDLGIVMVGDFDLQNASPLPFQNDYLEGLMGVEPSPFNEEGDLDLALALPIPILSNSKSIEECNVKSDFTSNIPWNYCELADGESFWPYYPTFVTWEQGDCSLPDGCLNLQNPFLAWAMDAEMGYNVYRYSDEPVRNFNSGSQMVWAVPGYWGEHCDYGIGIQSIVYINSYILPQDTQKLYQSPQSVAYFERPCPIYSGRLVEVTFENIEFLTAPVEEPEEGDFLDVYGHFSLGAYPMELFFFGISGFQVTDGCPTPDSPGINKNAAFDGRCPIRNDGTTRIDLFNNFLCHSKVLGCNEPAYSQGNNSVFYYVFEDSSPIVLASILDHDVNSADDWLCKIDSELPDIADIGSEPALYEISGEGCKLRLTIRAYTNVEN